VSSGTHRRCSRVRGALLGLGLAASLVHAASAQQPDQLVGDWFLTLAERSAVHTGVLRIERAGGSVAAFVDGGPASFALTDGNIDLEFDTRDGGGQLLRYLLNGKLNGGELEGVLTPPLNAPQGTWRATRLVVPPAAPPKPVDFTGVWSRTSSGLARVTLDYTPNAQSVVDAYHYLDDPALRCVSPGLVRVSGWPYPLEIVQNDAQVTILYESFHEVRRIFLDDRRLPEKLPHRSMGYSRGSWDGSTLVVETTMLTPGYVDLGGQPLSENSRVVERMSLSAHGQVLRSELTVHDPENYRRPITRHRAWRKTPQTTILEYDCDPYPFFRGLEIEGKLEEYWERMRRRR
jgi:hypothetical protein